MIAAGQRWRASATSLRSVSTSTAPGTRRSPMTKAGVPVMLSDWARARLRSSAVATYARPLQDPRSPGAYIHVFRCERDLVIDNAQRRFIIFHFGIVTDLFLPARHWLLRACGQGE